MRDSRIGASLGRAPRTGKFAGATNGTRAYQSTVCATASAA